MIQINYRDSRPIYEQVKDGFRKLIMNQLIEKDEKLPSVREIAKDLAINPNTIQRAYRELETEGYVYTIAGKGCFCAGIPEKNNARCQELFREFDKITEELILMGFSEEELEQHIQTLKNKGGNLK